MGRTFIRRFEDFMYRFLRPYGVYRIRKLMPNVTYDIGEGVDFKRTEPFLLIGNHQYEVDSGLYATPWKKKPIAVISRSLMVSPYKKFKFKFLTSGIPKSQGEPEIHSIRRMIQTIKDGDPLFVLPEGEISYFGESLPIDDSVAKLAKKLKVDVISAVSKGGFISSPRWGSKLRDNRFVFVEFKKLISKEKIKEMNVDDVYTIIKEKLYVNDYDFQRENMIKVGGKRRAEGLEKFLFVCTECGSFHTLETSKTDIFCTSCGARATMDEYGFLQGMKYDNTIDWSKHQDSLRNQLKETEFSTPGIFYKVNYEKYSSRRIGAIELTYKDGLFYITGSVNETIPINETKYFRLTQLNVLTFDYNGKHYYIRIERNNEAFKQVTIGESYENQE